MKKGNKTEINCLQLLTVVRSAWKQLLITCICSAVIGIVVAFSIPRIYKARVVLAPETASGTNLTSSISSLASMIGMDMQFGGGSDAIFPEIYPDLMKSTDFLVSLFPIHVVSADGKISTNYYDYMKDWQKVAWWSYPKLWIIKVIRSLQDKGNDTKGKDIDPFRLTRDQFEVAQSISGNINCNVDKKTSVISIEITDQDPLISASIADSVKTRLQMFITNYRTNKARNDMAYMEKLFDEAKEQYAKARRLYSSYADTNQELQLQSFRGKLEDLENEMQLKYNIYTQVTEQLQLARAKVQERTPAFTVVQSATVPVKHSNTPKVFILAVFILIGIAIHLCVLTYRNRNTIFTRNQP